VFGNPRGDAVEDGHSRLLALYTAGEGLSSVGLDPSP
jgi:hypothetical protein